MSDEGASAGPAPDGGSDPGWEEVPPALAAVARRSGISPAELIAFRDAPENQALAPPQHDEEMLVRFVAPVLGAAVDAGWIDAERVAVYVEQTAGFADDVVAAAVRVSLPAAASMPVAELGDALGELLDELEVVADAGPLSLHAPHLQHPLDADGVVMVHRMATDSAATDPVAGGVAGGGAAPSGTVRGDPSPAGPVLAGTQPRGSGGLGMSDWSADGQWRDTAPRWSRRLRSSEPGSPLSGLVRSWSAESGPARGPPAGARQAGICGAAPFDRCAG